MTCDLLPGAVQLACGADHSVYLDRLGRAYAFGENSRGQLGLGHCDPALGVCEMRLPGLAVDVPCGGSGFESFERFIRGLRVDIHLILKEF